MAEDQSLIRLALSISVPWKQLLWEPLGASSWAAVGEGQHTVPYDFMESGSPGCKMRGSALLPFVLFWVLLLYPTMEVD